MISKVSSQINCPNFKGTFIFSSLSHDVERLDRVKLMVRGHNARVIGSDVISCNQSDFSFVGQGLEHIGIDYIYSPKTYSGLENSPLLANLRKCFNTLA